MDGREYYSDPVVRARLHEYLRGARYFTTHRHVPFELADGMPPERLPQELQQECELSRALEDRSSLLAHLDIEHVHFDQPEDSFLNSWLAFSAQQPLVLAVQEVLAGYGLAPLHLLSGRGHHFVWSVAQDSTVFERLADDPLADPYSGGPGTPPRVAAAHSTVGRLMEFIAHEALRRVSGSPLPIELGAIECPLSPRGREIVSLDLSEYGDPLAFRAVRLPFSLYLKARRLLGPDAGHLAMVPLHEMDLVTALQTRRDLERVRELARRTVVTIPEQPKGTANLLDGYQQSPLARTHHDYYSEAQSCPRSLPQLPPCVELPLLEPNDWLLKPAVLQHLVRFFVGQGWHPRHVAGLVRERYLADAGWVPAVHFYDPSWRADFYVRLYASALLEGLDRLADFDCSSTAQKGYCPGPGCGLELADLVAPQEAR